MMSMVEFMVLRIVMAEEALPSLECAHRCIQHPCASVTLVIISG